MGRGVGAIAVGDRSGIRGGADWGDSGGLDRHRWAFDRFTTLLEYEAEKRGVDVERVEAHGTSKTRLACGTEEGSQRVGRGL